MSKEFTEFPARLDAAVAETNLWQEARPAPGTEQIPENYFQSLPWFQLLAEHCLASDSTPKIYHWEPEPRSLRVSLPMQHVVKSSILGTCRLTRSLTNYLSCAYGPMVFGNSTAHHSTRCGLRELINGVLRHEAETDLIQWDTLAFHDEGQFTDFEHALETSEWPHQRYFHFGNWFEPVAGRGYAHYLADLSSSQRYRIRRAERRLHKVATANIDIVRTASGVGRAWSWYQQVYRHSWKRYEEWQAFIGAVVHQAALDGALRLGTLLIDDTPVASQIWFVFNRRATIFKLAYHQDFAKLSVGTVLTAAMFNDVLSRDQVEEVDFGRGDDPYKKDWLSQRREFWGIQAYNPRRFHGVAGAARHKLPTLVRENLHALTSGLRLLK